MIRGASPMVKKVFSIIIPTVADSPPTLQSLPSEEDLISMGGELIVVRDRWRNASRARNIGATVARGTIFCFIDDDAAFNFSELYDYIKKSWIIQMFSTGPTLHTY